MKMISSTSMTSMNGVTLISWLTLRSSSPSLTFIAIGLTCSGQGAPVEIAAGQAKHQGCRVAEQAAMSGNDARKGVVDDAGGGRPDPAERGRAPRRGNAGPHHHEVGGLRLRDADEARHDTPHGAEQPDERCARSDGGQH